MSIRLNGQPGKEVELLISSTTELSRLESHVDLRSVSFYGLPFQKTWQAELVRVVKGRYI